MNILAKIKGLLSSDVSFGKPKQTDILLFTKHLSVVLKSGLTLAEGLSILESQSKASMKKVVKDLLKRVQGGQQFHSALSAQGGVFKELYINMVKAGETSGLLQENLERLHHELEKSFELKRKIRSASIYPVFVFIAVFGLGMSVSLFVLPKITPLFLTLDVELPLSTRVLMYISSIFEAHGTVILISSVVGFIFLFWLLKRKWMRPVSHRLLLMTPFIGEVIEKMSLAEVSRTLGALLKSGQTLSQSLHVTSNAVSNYMYSSTLIKITPAIESGQAMSTVFGREPKYFPPIVVRMIDVGERTGNLDETLLYLADYYESEVEDATKNLSIIIEPILLITIGLIVGGVAIAILGPIYEITGNLRV